MEAIHSGSAHDTTTFFALSWQLLVQFLHLIRFNSQLQGIALAFFGYNVPLRLLFPMTPVKIFKLHCQQYQLVEPFNSYLPAQEAQPSDA
jgi:hypothetical protein